MQFFPNIPGKLPDELFDALLESNNLCHERIVSHSHNSPEDFWHDQEQHEWVFLVRGAAKLRFEEEEYLLKPGDCVNVAAHERQRVEWTTLEEQTIWSAMFYS